MQRVFTTWNARDGKKARWLPFVLLALMKREESYADPSGTGVQKGCAAHGDAMIAFTGAEPNATMAIRLDGERGRGGVTGAALPAWPGTAATVAAWGR